MQSAVGQTSNDITSPPPPLSQEEHVREVPKANKPIKQPPYVSGWCQMSVVPAAARALPLLARPPRARRLNTTDPPLPPQTIQSLLELTPLLTVTAHQRLITPPPLLG